MEIILNFEIPPCGCSITVSPIVKSVRVPGFSVIHHHEPVRVRWARRRYSSSSLTGQKRESPLRIEGGRLVEQQLCEEAHGRDNAEARESTAAAARPTLVDHSEGLRNAAVSPADKGE